MAAQIVVSVTTALAVAFITNAWIGSDEAPKTAAEVASISAPADSTPQPEPAARPHIPAAPAGLLPPLQTELIVNRPVAGEALLPEGAEIFPGVPAGGALAATAQREAAPPAPGTASAAEEPPAPTRRLLGLPLPYFVPTAGEMVQSAGTAGSRLISLVAGD